MKKIFYLIILALLPVSAFSQDGYDKYLEGAVTMVDGRVIFDREITVKGLAAGQVFNALNEWAALEYTGEGRQVISSDNSVNRITVRGMDRAQVRVGLFPSKININYFLIADCHEGGCKLSFMRFVYTNNPSSDSPDDQIKAEDYIIDKYALNKTGTKLVGGTGDYRSGSHVFDHYLMKNRAPAYGAMALAMKLAMLLGLSWPLVIMAARAANLLMYIILMYIAMERELIDHFLLIPVSTLVVFIQILRSS